MSFVCSGAAPAFDAALASFSAHHLRGAEEKGRFLGGVRRHLKTGSTLYVVDVFREAQVRCQDHWARNSLQNKVRKSKSRKGQHWCVP